MKTIRTLFIRLIGLVFAATGAFTIVSGITDYLHEPDFFKFVAFGLFMVIFGVLLVIFAGHIVDANAPERIGKTNKYVARQLFLFAMLMLAYIVLAAFRLVNHPTKTVVYTAIIGGIAVILAYFYLIYSVAKQRKNSKLQDGSFENVRMHENNSLFTMVIDCCWFDEGKMYIRGDVHGKVSINDVVYFYYPNDKVYIEDIIGIEVKGKTKNSVADQRATLIFKAKGEVYFAQYTVCSSCIPASKNNLDTHMTNPDVLGLINGYPEHETLDAYFNEMMDAIVHGRYLVRVTRKIEHFNLFQKIYYFFFPYLGPFSMATVLNANQDVAIGVYTDWNALKLGKENDEKDKEAMVLTFDEIQHLINDSIHLPIVINPFNQTHLYFSLEQLQSIVNSQAYQERVLNNKTK